jgi:hypothetical protein
MVFVSVIILLLISFQIVDHTTHDFKKDDGVTFVIED